MKYGKLEKQQKIKAIANELYALEEAVLRNNQRLPYTDIESLAKFILKIATATKI